MKNLLFLLLICPLIGVGQIQLQSSLENALPSGWQGASNVNYSPFALIEGSETWSHSIQSSILRTGKFAWQMEIRPGDREVYFGSYRAEITLTSKGTAQTYQPNAFRMSTYVPSGVWANSALPECFPFQNHPYSPSYNGGSASLYIEVKNGIYSARIIHTNGSATPGATEVITTIPIGPVERDAWVDWVVYYDPKATTDGRVIIWRKVIGVDADYRKVVDYTGRTLHGWSQWPFLKAGIYWWNRPASGTASQIRRGYIDAVAFGKATPTTALDLFRLDPATPPPPNQPPICSAGSAQALAGGTTSTTLSGTDLDPDGTINLRNWAQINGPTTVTFGTPNAASTTVGNLTTGTYTFFYTVTDNNGAAAQSSVTVTVATANTAPVVPPMASINRPAGSTTAQLDGEATDAQDAVLTNKVWSVVSKPIGSPDPTFAPNANDWNPIVGNLVSGSYVFKLTVTDSNGASSFNTVAVTVAAANQLPVVTPAAPIIVVRSTTSSSSVAVSASDPDGSIASYNWIMVNGPNTPTASATTTANPTYSNLVIGSYFFECTVTDNSGAQVRAQVSLRVNRPPDTDVDTTLAFSFAKGVTNIPLYGEATDADGSVTQYRWRIVQGNGTFADSTAANTTFTATGPGTYVLELVAMDNDSEEGTATYEFIIQAGYLIQKRGLRKSLP